MNILNESKFFGKIPIKAIWGVPLPPLVISPKKIHFSWKVCKIWEILDPHFFDIFVKSVQSQYFTKSLTPTFLDDFVKSVQSQILTHTFRKFKEIYASILFFRVQSQIWPTLLEI